MILVIDNYDSFTYNLVALLQICGASVIVRYHDHISIDFIQTYQPKGIVISPGTGTPKNTGDTAKIIEAFYTKIPFLGVCLGHQLLAEMFGGRVILADKPIHGKISDIYHHSTGIFCNLPSPFQATRYHSLVVERESLPGCLTIEAETKWGEIMALKHQSHAIFTTQFHPEAYLTQYGKELIQNWLNITQETT